MKAGNWVLAAVVVLAMNGSTSADDTFKLGGRPGDAQTMTLRGSRADDAETIEIFHKFGKGCGGCCYKKQFVWNAPIVTFGYIPGYVASAFSLGFAAPTTVAYAVPRTNGYTFAPPASYAYSNARPTAPLPSARVTVTTPRLDFGLTVANNGIVIGRSSLTNGRLAGPTEDPIEAPSSEQLPSPRTAPPTYRYDGGPANPVPLPGGPAPATAPNEVRPTTPPVTRVVSQIRKSIVYPAYGERVPPTRSAPPTVLVKKPAN